MTDMHPQARDDFGSAEYRAGRWSAHGWTVDSGRTGRPTAVEGRAMHIAMVGPMATADVAHLLRGDTARLPCGYEGAPLLATLVSALIARGHRVTAITTTADLPLDWRKPVVARGRQLQVVYVPMRARAWRPNGMNPGRIVDLFAFERRGLVAAIKTSGADVVHAHWAYEFALSAIDSGLPHVVTSHDAPHVIARVSRSWYRRLRQFMARRVLRQAQCVSTVSPYLVDEIASYCSSLVELVPNPLPEKAFAPNVLAPRTSFDVAMVCNGWNWRKNPEAGLRAFASIARKLPLARLIAWGSDFGPGQAAEQWWQREGLHGRVIFRGPTPHDQVLRELRECAVLIHPAREESFAAVVAEAMACGVPVVAGRSSGGVPWVVGDAGYLVDIERPSEIAQAALHVLERPENARLLAQRAQRQARERFAADSVAARFEVLYRRATERGLA